MKLPKELLLSDLLNHSVRCDLGIDHGYGLVGWMHPPVHRLLGWATKPSALKMSRDVWSLDQIKAITKNQIFVKGKPVISDQLTLDRIPTLLDANLLSINSENLGLIADLVFSPLNGKIFYYLVSRSDPRIPGSSRWKLTIDRIRDQQPGMVSSSLTSLDDMPLVKASIRQELIRQSKEIKQKFYDISETAAHKFEGWLEEAPWEQDNQNYSNYHYEKNDPLDDWYENDNINHFDKFNKPSQDYLRDAENSTNIEDEKDPWI